MLTHINDLHVGVVRSGGTTPASAYELRLYALTRFQALLEQITTDLLIDGDLFDTFMVALADFLKTFFLLRDWLIRNPDKRLLLSPGNHDLSKNTTLKSSFQALASLLENEFPDRVVHIHKPMTFPYASMPCHVIPHMINQELFDAALAAVPAGTKYLFLHCNYDNKFSQQQDHSLNLSAEQAKACVAERIIIAHEHQRKIALTGKVLIVGNQFPTSVADCLGNSAKFMLKLHPGVPEWVQTWEGRACFEKIDWREALTAPSPTSEFIRVEGEATAAEATTVFSQIARLRSSHKAYVISNAVQIKSDKGDDLSVSLEQIKQFDVLTALLKYLSKDEGATVKKLLESADV